MGRDVVGHGLTLPLSGDPTAIGLDFARTLLGTPTEEGPDEGGGLLSDVETAVGGFDTDACPAGEDVVEVPGPFVARRVDDLGT